MKTTVQNQRGAITLRREGYSYTEIASTLKVSRASVCGWVKNVRLTEAEKALLAKNIKNRIDRGRLKARVTLHSQKVFKEKAAYEAAEREFQKMCKDPFFIYGMGLWGHEKPKKERTSFTYTASGEKNLQIMLKWMEKYLEIPAKMQKIRVYKGKRGEAYSFTISKIRLVRRILAWQKLTMLYYS